MKLGDSKIFAEGLRVLLRSFQSWERDQVFRWTLNLRLLANKMCPDRWPWWDRVSEQLILGGIPLKSKKHHEVLLREAKSLSVLSLLEDLEINGRGLFFEVLSQKDWQECGVEHCHVPVPDFSSLSLTELDKSVAFITEQVVRGKTVYIHCKAGRGRSATALICYLMKTSRMTSLEAIQFVKQRRPQIKPNARQLQSIEDYYRFRCVNQK